MTKRKFNRLMLVIAVVGVILMSYFLGKSSTSLERIAVALIVGQAIGYGYLKLSKPKSNASQPEKNSK